MSSLKYGPTRCERTQILSDNRQQWNCDQKQAAKVSEYRALLQVNSPYVRAFFFCICMYLFFFIAVMLSRCCRCRLKRLCTARSSSAWRLSWRGRSWLCANCASNLRSKTTSMNSRSSCKSQRRLAGTPYS